MEKLINDPECIPFMNKKQVSLPLLKNEIDRRILKITTMIKRKKKQKSQHEIPSFQNKYVQTENIEGLHILNEDSPQEINILCPSKKYQPNLQQKQAYKLRVRRSPKKIQGSQNVSNKKIRNLQRQSNSQLRFKTSQTQIQEQMIQSNRFTFRANRSQQNSEIKARSHQKQGQNDQIFQKIDFATEIQSFGQRNNRKKSLYNSEQCNDYLRSEETLISFHTDFSGSDRAKLEPVSRRKNTKGARIPSRDLTISQPEHRFVVSIECLQRMKGQAEELTQGRRKELRDSKVRQNMLKKIEERYGELDCS